MGFTSAERRYRAVPSGGVILPQQRVRRSALQRLVAMPIAIRVPSEHEADDQARPRGPDQDTLEDKVYHGYATVTFPGPFESRSRMLSGERAKQAEQEWVEWFTSANSL